MLTIQTTGVEDFLDGSANIKALVIGGPGAGKTRSASYWPKPIFLDTENGRGSLADRKMPYVVIRSSKDALDALEYLKGLESTPKARRSYQTVVFDTVDSFQRLVKDEWVQLTKAAVFTGYDAWGYLDTKMQFLFTRLLNLDYNVIVNVHYKDKTFKDSDDATHREFSLQLQGAISDQIFNDFGLVGYLGTYWEAGPDGRVQKRGMTFEPTPDKPFLKDRFHVTPKWMEITFTPDDYWQLFKAFDAMDDMPEATTVGEIPDSERPKATPERPVNPPAEGGPLPPKEGSGKPVEVPQHVPLEKRTKEELTGIAKELGQSPRANMLKSELVEMITEARDEASRVSAPVAVDAPTASPPEPEPAPTSSAPPVEQPPPMTPEQVAAQIGAEVISEQRHDTPPAPTTPAPAASQGPSACADCTNDLTGEWEDPVKRQYVRLSFVKFRRYLCGTCYANALN